MRVTYVWTQNARVIPTLHWIFYFNAFSPHDYQLENRQTILKTMIISYLYSVNIPFLYDYPSRKKKNTNKVETDKQIPRYCVNYFRFSDFSATEVNPFRIHLYTFDIILQTRLGQILVQTVFFFSMTAWWNIFLFSCSTTSQEHNTVGVNSR